MKYFLDIFCKEKPEMSKVLIAKNIYRKDNLVRIIAVK